MMRGLLSQRWLRVLPSRTARLGSSGLGVRVAPAEKRLKADLPGVQPAAKFAHLGDMSKEEFQGMTKAYQEICTPDDLARRALDMLRAQDNGFLGGAGVTLYEHGLQTATRALRAGASEEVVVAALLHDVGELLAPMNHGTISAGLLEPFLSPETHWVLSNHEVFQMYYYAHHSGMDRNVRDRFSKHPFYEACRKFCEDYDAPSFDPEYDSLPLEHFQPMVVRVFSKKPFWWDPTHPKAGAVIG